MRLLYLLLSYITISRVEASQPAKIPLSKRQYGRVVPSPENNWTTAEHGPYACYPLDQTHGELDFSAPCAAADLLQARCTFNGSLETDDNATTSAWLSWLMSLVNHDLEKTLHRSNNKTEQACLCNSYYWQYMNGCADCWKSLGSKNVTSEAQVSRLSSAYCAPTQTARFEDFYYPGNAAHAISEVQGNDKTFSPKSFSLEFKSSLGPVTTQTVNAPTGAMLTSWVLSLMSDASSTPAYASVSNQKYTPRTITYRMPTPTSANTYRSTVVLTSTVTGVPTIGAGGVYARPTSASKTSSTATVKNGAGNLDASRRVACLLGLVIVTFLIL